MSAAAPVARPAPARWVGLDALRGLSIAAMILVNNPGAWGARYQYPPLRHAAWHGCTFTDLVFPTFLFCAGVAIVPALSKKRAAGVPRAPLFAGMLRRVVLLVLFGLLLSAFPLLTFTGDDLLAPLWRTRFPGVLQRIGVCYGVAAVLFLLVTERTLTVVTWACLLGYWALITLVPVPGVGAPDLAGPLTTLQGYVDRAVFGSHIHVKDQYDPEGLLSTIPAVATCLFGVAAGLVLQREPAPQRRLAGLAWRGASLMLLGHAWSYLLPFNKPLWTSSYAVWTAGIATVALGVLASVFEAPGRERFARPLRVYGTNALLVFVGSGLLARVVGRLWTVGEGDAAMSAQQWFFRHALLEPIGDPRLASLAYSVTWMLGWYLVLEVLFRRGIVLRV